MLTHATPWSPSTCTSWEAHAASGLLLKCARSRSPSLRLPKDVGVQGPDGPSLSRSSGILRLTVWRKQAGWENPSIPWADPGWSRGAAPPPPNKPGQPEARGSSSCTAAFVALGKVQKAVPHAPSRRTKGHIDWFVGVFPGVLYISLPCCRNEEAESTDEGIGQHTSIRVGFLHLINQDFN